MEKNFKTMFMTEEKEKDISMFQGQVAFWRLENLVKKIKFDKKALKNHLNLKSSC